MKEFGVNARRAKELLEQMQRDKLVGKKNIQRKGFVVSLNDITLYTQQHFGTQEQPEPERIDDSELQHTPSKPKTPTRWDCLALQNLSDISTGSSARMRAEVEFGSRWPLHPRPLREARTSTE